MKIDPKKFAKMLVDFLRPLPTKVIHNNNHTIILFDDGSKTVTKPNGDKYDPYIGFCVAMTAKYFGSKKAAHEAYETLSGCKFHKQPEGVAEETQEQFNRKVAKFIEEVDEKINLLTEKRLYAKEAKLNAEEGNLGRPYCKDCVYHDLDPMEWPCSDNCFGMAVKTKFVKKEETKPGLNVTTEKIKTENLTVGIVDSTKLKSKNGRFLSKEEQQTEQKADSLQNSQSTDKYCHTCEYFNVSLNLEPCKSCRQIRTDDNRYPKWTAPNKFKKEETKNV